MIQTSIVIPTHNDDQCVWECVQGIIKNTNNYEIIFVLDSSVSFKEELKGFGKVVEVAEPFVFSHRINKGISVAEGEYLCILNDDTVPQPSWLERMIRDERVLGPGLVGASCQSGGCHNSDAFNPEKALYTKHTINMFATLFSRRLLDVVGPLDERFVRYGGDDDDYTLRARRHGFKTIISTGMVFHKKSQAFGIDRIVKELPETRQFFEKKWGKSMPTTLDANWEDFKHRGLTSPLVSVLMPTRNHEDYLTQAVKSVLSQSHKNIELLVGVDGEDQDRSLEVLSWIEDPRLRFWAFSRLGSCGVRNTLARRARGEFLVLMDSDDVMLPRRISSQLTAMDPNTDIVHTNFMVEGKTGKIEELQDCKPLPINREMLLDLRSVVAGGTMMLRRHVVALEPFSEYHALAFDFEYVLRNMNRFAFKYLAEPTIVYRRHSGAHLSGNTESVNVHRGLIEDYRRWVD